MYKRQELDLFKLIYKTLISLLCSRDSGDVDKGAAVGNCLEMMFVSDAETAMDNCLEMMFVSDVEAAVPPRIGTVVPFWS